MLERRSRRLAVALSMLALLLPAGARAQVALERFHAQPLASDGFGLARSELLAPGAWSALASLDYANDPLVYRLERGPGLRQSVVSDQLTLQLGGALGVHRRVMLAASLPVQLLMRGDADLAIPSMAPEGPGLGDLALSARIALTDPDRRTFSLNGELIARVPTAELARPSQRYSGDSIGSYEGALLGEVRLGIVAWRVRLGVGLRKPVQLQNLDLGQSLTFATGVQVRLPRNVSLHAELLGSTYLSHAFRQHLTPVELLLGPKLRFAHGWAGLAAGPGLVDGYGAPDFRVVGSIGLAAAAAPSRAKSNDSDGDGVADGVDGCAHEAEDRDGFEDADGCPDGDDDRDTLADAVDACPREAEDHDGHADDDGCPEQDEDVPQAAEQRRCPDGTVALGDDGCSPPPPASAPEQAAALEFGHVQFGRGREIATPESMPALRAVASILKLHPELKRLRIEGHADDTGDVAFNDRLSARRAHWVVRWLSTRGVAAERLEPVACGQHHPLQPDASESARSANRRVEFVELDPPRGTPRSCAALPP